MTGFRPGTRAAPWPRRPAAGTVVRCRPSPSRTRPRPRPRPTADHHARRVRRGDRRRPACTRSTTRSCGRQPGARARPARARRADRARGARSARSGPSPAMSPRCGRRSRSRFGVLATVNGAMHVQHIRVDGAAHSDLTGVLAFAAGLVLAGLAVVRSSGAAGAGGSGWLAVPVAILGSCPRARPDGAWASSTRTSGASRSARSPAPAYQEVAFRAGDGLQLPAGTARRATARPSCSCTAATATGRARARHAEMLAATGYGVLLYDARGRGHSEGSPNGYGWDWRKDVAGAMAFLKARPDVEPGRIGALGLSTGADVLVEVAADRDDLARDRRRRHGRRELRGLAPAARRRGRRRAGLDHVQDDRGALGRPAEPRARGPDPPGPPAAADGVRRHRRGVRVQRPLRPRGRSERRALEPAATPPTRRRSARRRRPTRRASRRSSTASCAENAEGPARWAGPSQRRGPGGTQPPNVKIRRPRSRSDPRMYVFPSDLVDLDAPVVGAAGLDEGADLLEAARRRSAAPACRARSARRRRGSCRGRSRPRGPSCRRSSRRRPRIWPSGGA